MHTRRLLPFLLISLALVIPTTSWAFLGRPGDRAFSTDPPPELTEVPPPAGIPGVAGRANNDRNFELPSFPTEPPPSIPIDTVPEPTPGLLVALGLTALALRWRSA